MIEIIYLASGLLLPLFYIPQIIRLHRDSTNLASFSLLKALTQLFLRLPVLFFAYVVVGNVYMNAVVTADVVGRAVECVVALKSLRRQGASHVDILERIIPPFLAQRLRAKTKVGDIQNETS